MIHHYTKGNSNSDSDKHIHEIIAMLSVVVVVVVVFILTGIIVITMVMTTTMSITNITKWYHHYHNMYAKACTLYCVCVFAHVATECHSSECQYPGQYRHTLHATQAHTYNTVYLCISAYLHTVQTHVPKIHDSPVASIGDSLFLATDPFRGVRPQFIRQGLSIRGRSQNWFATTVLYNNAMSRNKGKDTTQMAIKNL
jgi:hypothetical protein